ncbi:TetR/AcrR family transcriptional regulator [Microvirga sp. M2]|uniref:TetR/AcrR family transcriptional regulator n=1 Tax=Microvirga sp. M2 TaxID=3073270 RepID=UPI0039C1E087
MPVRPAPAGELATPEWKPRQRTLKSFQADFDFSLKAICARMVERHRATIRTQKQHVAVAKLMLIIQTTLTLANRKGFHSMSLRDLATESGLSMGALYTYFDTKDTLLMMILGEVSSAVSEALGSPPESVLGNPAERLHWLLETHVYLTEVMQPWFAFAYMEAKAFPREGREKATKSELSTEKLIADALTDGVKSGVFRIRDVEMTASLIKPLLQDWYVKRSKYRRRGISPEQYVQVIAEFVENAIRCSSEPVTAKSRRCDHRSGAALAEPS